MRISDWSSDVCSSDLIAALRQAPDLKVLPVGRRVVVIGGGNTAIDIAVQTRRLGAEEVTLVYRRGPEALSATHHEEDFAQTCRGTLRHWAQPKALAGEGGELNGATFASPRLGTHPSPGTGQTPHLEGNMPFTGEAPGT